MRKLTRIVAPALLAALALGGAMPAHAYPDRFGHSSISSEIDRLQRAVSRSDYRDRISEREAASLRRDVQKLRQQYRAFSRDGLSRHEYRILEKRLDAIRDRLRHERRDLDRRPW